MEILPLFIDYNKIIIGNNIKLYFTDINSKKYNIGMILLLPSNSYRKFVKSDNKVKTLSEKWFIDNIVYKTYYTYIDDESLYELINYTDSYLNTILKGFSVFSPSNCFIYITPKPKLGGLEFICKSKTSPMGIRYKTEKSFYLLKNCDKSLCNIKFYINRGSLVYLQQLVNKGGAITKNSDGSETQKEASGGLVIIGKKSGIYQIGVNKKQVKYNKEETADICPSLYNFHSHPHEAYIKYGNKYAWPSMDDYIACVYSIKYYHTIFHLVASIEGIYIISISKYWSVYWDSVDIIDWIKKQYKIRYKNGMTIDWYLNKVNCLTYGNKPPIFKVEYQSWKTHNKVFNVYFNSKNKCKIV